MSSFPLRKPTAETKLTAWMKVLWSVQLTSAVGVTAWASSIQPGAKYTADWVIPISGTLLLVAFVLAKRASDSSSRSGAEIPIAAAWSLGLAALALSAAGRWLGGSLWQAWIVASATTLLLIIHRPFRKQDSPKDYNSKHRREHPQQQRR